MIGPSPTPLAGTKPYSVKRRAAGFILATIAGIFLWLFIIGQSEKPSGTVSQMATKPVATEADDRARREAESARKADELARKEAEEVKCRTDIKCIGDKKSVEATFKCAPLVEKLAKNNFEWLDKWYEPKFSHFRWKDQKNVVVTYIGDKIKFQNGFGAWILSRYECDYSVPTGAVLDVRASAGRLPS